jgi:hypothetical protein
VETLAYSFGPRDHAGQKPLRERPVERLDFVGVLMLGRAVAIIFGHPFMERSALTGGVGKTVRQWKLTGIRPSPDEMFQTGRIA